MASSKDFRLVLKVKNNNLLSRREAFGITQAKMAEAIGIPLQRYIDLESLNASSLDKDGCLTSWALAVVEFYDVDSSVLFPECINRVVKSRFTKELGSEELQSYRQQLGSLDSDDSVFFEEIRSLLLTRDDLLSEKHKFILIKRFGFDGDAPMSFAEIGKSMSPKLNHQLVHDAYNRAMLKLRRRLVGVKLRRRSIMPKLVNGSLK